MTRNMIEANLVVFQLLEGYCARFDSPIPSAGRVRYVAGGPEDQAWLKNVELRTQLKFSQGRFLASLRYNHVDYIALVGFDFDVDIGGLLECEVNAGAAVCLWSELRPRPIAGPATVRNVVEVSAFGDAHYQGHDWEVVAELLPAVRLVRANGPLDDEAIWRLFFWISADESRRSNSWMDEDLSQELMSLADLNVPVLPYGPLCRSLFDADPRSLFMALYRCVEATYAYETCKNLVAKLALGEEWHELAALLDAEMGWRPQEATSLQLVLKYALPADLLRLRDALEADGGDDATRSTAKALYRLRNEVVHFRPTVERLNQEDLDWNAICYRLVGIVFNVFSYAFEH